MAKDLRGKKVLVTGGAGFIGSHTVDALLREGAEVVVVDNLSTGVRENLNARAKFHEMNIGEAKIEEIIERERPEIIYHFAFYVLVPKSVDDPLKDMDVVVGTLRMLKKVRQMGIEKFVFPSSGFLYGNESALPAKEEYPVRPVSPYVVSKNTIENYLRFFRAAYGLPYVVLRYAAIYGPRQRTGAMADYIRKLAKGQQAEMWGDGDKTRDYVFIEDVVRANLLALDVRDDHPDPVFNIGTGVETTLNALYGKIAKIFGRQARPTYHPDRLGEQMRYCLDNSKIRRELGWEPLVGLDEGLKATVEHARSRGFEI